MDHKEASGTNCPLCGDLPANHRVVSTRDRTGKPLRSVICLRCGLVFTSPMPSAAELNKYYEAQYRMDYQTATAPHPRHILRAFRMAMERYEALRPYLPPDGRSLDVGAGGGEWAHLLGRVGFNSTGVEPSHGFAEHARRAYGANIIDAPLSLAGIEGPFDLVTAFHVFEHLPDPAAAFAAVRRLIRPGGRLIIEVPNITARHQTKRSKFHRAHVIGFTPDTLAAMVARSGYTVVADLSGGPDAQNVRMVFTPGTPQREALPPPTSVDRTVAALSRRRLLHSRSLPNAVGKLSRSVEERLATRHKSASEIADNVLARIPAGASR